MKKCGLLIMLLGLMFSIPGCGYDTGGEDITVTVIEATPTPEPTPTPEVTPTPEATPTPAPVIEQTASGVNIEKKDGTYVAAADLNLRSDCSTDADLVTSVPAGTELTSTGVSDNGWIEISYQGTTCYVSGDYVTASTADAGTADAQAADQAQAQ